MAGETHGMQGEKEMRSIWWLWAGCVAVVFLLSPAHAAMQSMQMMPLDILDVVATPHQFSDEFRYSRDPSPELGALVRLVVRHRDVSGKAVFPVMLFNGRKASEWIASGDWSWHETPENLGAPDSPHAIAPGALAVFTFNADKAAWGAGSTVEISIADGPGGAPETVRVPVTPDPLRVRSVVCLAAEPEGLVPERLVVHLSNSSPEAATVRGVAVYPQMTLESRAEARIECVPADAVVPAGGRSVVLAQTGPLPLRHGLVEVMLETADGVKTSRWARLRFKADRFDIGSGWLDIPSKEGVVPLLRESYLKTLRRMHVNLIHCENVPGYTDATGPEGLYTRYPMRLMGGFADIEKYNTDEWAPRIHGVDRVGEPQMGQKPMETYEALKPYDSARYPTTVTLSDEGGWRRWAGLSDFPHFDSYRVSAPAMDAWRKYDRWDKKIMWGAPLEGIGAMTRSLRELSEPLPVALWSQNAHEGWQDQFMRKRRSPTPDEIIAQAHQGLANGVIGLYWYSLQSWSLLKYRDVIETTTRIGREIRLLEDLYLSGIATHHARLVPEGKPSVDLNVIAAPKATLLFAMDLDYYPDHEARVFRFREPRGFTAEFPLPGWLRNPADLFRVDADGVHDVQWENTGSGVRLNDTLDRTAVYVAALSGGERAARAGRLAELKADEAALNFDPANNEADFTVLLHELGFENVSELEKFK